MIPVEWCYVTKQIKTVLRSEKILDGNADSTFVFILKELETSLQTRFDKDFNFNSNPNFIKDAVDEEVNQSEAFLSVLEHYKDNKRIYAIKPYIKEMSDRLKEIQAIYNND